MISGIHGSKRDSEADKLFLLFCKREQDIYFFFAKYVFV
jgi:hypothetical protein